MPESPQAFHARAQREGLRTPPVEEWETWPFEGAVTPKILAPPVEAEAARSGAGGVDCWSCGHGTDGSLWANENWLVRTTGGPTGLPFVCFLETRRHLDFHELDDELAAELGPMLLKVQRAVYEIGDVGNVHVCRWGDGSEHFHVWFMARPARIPQLAGSFAAIWDDVLPPLPHDLWQANADRVAAALAA
jgi:hypothetical protein